jgi:hypothetical protein
VAQSPVSVTILLAIRSEPVSLGWHVFRITTLQQAGRRYVSCFMTAERVYAPPAYASGHRPWR